LIRSV